MQIEHQPLIPLSILKDLRCRNCEKFVTCGPVQVLPDESMLCGRCQQYEKKVLYRNTSYEALASMFVYPCYNWEKHCNRQLKWNQSLEHEPNCAYTDCCSRFWRRGFCCRGKRSIPYGDIRLVPVPERLLESIKCVQCESYLSCEPVFIQTNGKNVCHRCIYVNGPPPNSIRNYTYENLSSIIIFPCIFRNRGCPTRLKFGRDLWHHESGCSYNQIYTKKNSGVSGGRNQKERGVITTHSGHTYGTITPNSLLFAPPTPNRTEFDMNKEILKSLKKHQERKVVSADQIESQFAEKYSEDGSIENEEVRNNSPINKYRQDETQARHAYQNLSYTDSGYMSEKANYSRNLMLGAGAQGRSPSPHSPSPVSPHQYPHNYYNSPGAIPKPDYYSENDEGNHRNSEEYFRNAEVKGLAYQPSIKGGVAGGLNGTGLDRSESVRSNRELIQELKVKQKVMKNNSMNKDIDSPYTNCNNLEEVIQVHDNIAK